MLRKCGLYLLSFAVLCISLSVFFSDVSSAASIYDDVYKPTDKIELYFKYAGADCSAPDIDQNWYSTALDSSAYNGNDSAFDSYKSSLTSAINGNGRWGVSVMHQKLNLSYGVYDKKAVTIFWTEDDSLYLEWNPGAVVAKGNSIKYIDLLYSGDYYGNSSCDIIGAYGNGEREISHKQENESSSLKNRFVYTDHLNLPDGYEGEIPLESLDDDREIIRPDFKYIVNDKSLSLTDYNKKLPDFTPDEGYTFNGYEVEWSLFKCDVSDNSPSTCLNPELSDHQILPQSTTYQYSVDEYHMYMIEAQYLVQQCYRYPSYPETPDYCFYVDLNTEFDDYRFLPTSVSLDIDGSVIIGDTTQNDCDESGYCQPKKGNDLYEYFNGRENFGLTAILLAPILFYQQLPSLAESCTPINFSWFGRPVSLPCIGNSMQIWSPTVFGIYQAVVNAFVAYYVALGIFRTIKTVNDPKEDRIEVTTL